MTRKQKVLAGIAAGAVVLIVVVYFVGKSWFRSSKLAPFRPHLDSYLAENKGPLPPPTQGEPVVRYKGKMILVDVKSRDFDPLYFSLPEDLVAQKPEEVGTIVQLKYGNATYAVEKRGGGSVSKEICDVFVLDRATGMLVDSVKIEGPRPVSEKWMKEDDGSPLASRITKYLSGLKRE